MSLPITEAKIYTPVPSTADPGVPAGKASARPSEPARIEGVRRTERRRKGSPGESPMEILRRLPAVVVLERVPVPSLAMARDGSILFVNTAFAEMVGYRRDRLAGAAFSRVFDAEPAAMTALSGVEALANMVVELQHCEGWTVRARMSRSAFLRHDDPVVLVTFEEVTEQLWLED